MTSREDISMQLTLAYVQNNKVVGTYEDISNGISVIYNGIYNNIDTFRPKQ